MSGTNLDELRKQAHDAPMNKVFERRERDGTITKFLGTHSMAWAEASNRYVEALNKSVQS